MNAEPLFSPGRRLLWLAPALLLALPPVAAALELVRISGPADAEPDKAKKEEKPAAFTIPRTLLSHKAAKAQMLWRNGEALDGELAGADAADLMWKSDLFSEPLKVGRDYIRLVDFRAGSLESKGAFRAAMADGSHLTGDLLRMDGATVVLKSERCGEITLKRDAIVCLERLSGPGLLAASPLALLKGSTELNRSSQPNAGPLRFAAGGFAASHAYDQISGVKLDLPEKCIADLRYRTDGPPEFSLQAGKGKQSVSVESWGDELVLVMGDRFASAGVKFDDKARVAHVRLAWDRKEGRAALYGEDGSLWAEILPEPPKAPEPEVEKKAEKSKGSWLNRLFGAPDAPVEIERANYFPQSTPQDGITLTNKGRGILIERFSIGEWNGKPPPALITGAASVETGSEILAGEPEAIDGDKLTLKLKDGSSREVPLASVRALRWPREVKLERDAAMTDLWYDDGSLVRGKLGEIKDGKARVEASFAAAPVLISTTGARALLLPDPPAESKPPEKKEEPLLPPPALASVEVKPDTKLDSLDTLTIGKTSLHGRIVSGGGRLPQFQAFGSSTPATPSDASGMTLARALPPDAKYERAKALLHVTGQQSLPVTLREVDRKRVAFTWEGAEKQEIDAASVHAIQFAPAAAGDEGFSSPSWQIVGRMGAEKKPVRRPNGDIVLQPGAGIGHPWVLQGGDISFKLGRDQGGMSTLRIRLFCNGTQRETSSVNYILADYGSEIYCGVEREEGQMSSNTDIPSRSSGNDVNISFQGSYVEVTVNGTKLPRAGISTASRKRGGSGLVLETASLWGNSEGSVKLSSFATKSSALMASPPGFLESAKKEALLLPRLRRDDPPRHMLIGINGDLLRGEIEGITSTHYAFRSGIESFKVPRERVTAVVSLTKPEKKDPAATAKAAEPKKEEPKDEPRAGGGLWGALFGGGVARAQVRAAGQIVVRNGVLIEGEDGEEKPEKPEPPDKDVPNSGEQWLDLTNGGRIALKVDKWEAENVTGTHPLLGKVSIPVALVYRVTMKAPPASGAWSALSKWKLENTPDPVIPKDEKAGDGSAGGGAPAADFKLATLDGKSFSLSDGKGKVIVLDFWATWCGPCVKSLPGLIEAMSAFPEDKVVFLAVNQGETKDQVKKFLEARGFNIRVGMDEDQSVAKKFGVEGIPHTVVIDPGGKVVLAKTGYTADGDKEIAEAVTKALSGETPAAPPAAADKPQESAGDLLPPPVLR